MSRETDKLSRAIVRIRSIAEDVLLKSNDQNITKTFTKETLTDLIKVLEKKTVYLVEVKWSPANTKHEAILMTGNFRESGIHWEIWNSSYNRPDNLQNTHSIRVIKKLTKMKN